MEHRHTSGSSGCPFFQRRQSIKRSYSAMTEAHRSSSPASTLFVSQDSDSYINQRPAAADSITSHIPPSRYPGDGLDYRRPIMTQSLSATNASASTFIDLTQDTGQQESTSHTSQPTFLTGRNPFHMQRLPAFDRDIIDVAGERQADGRRNHVQGHSRSALYPQFEGEGASRGAYNPQLHPRYSVLRRPERNVASADSEVEIIGERIRSRPNTISRSHTPAGNAPGDLMGHPIDVEQQALPTIDLTADPDDNDNDLEITGGSQRRVNPTRPDPIGSINSLLFGPGEPRDHIIADRQPDQLPRLRRYLENTSLNDHFDFANMRNMFGTSEASRVHGLQTLNTRFPPRIPPMMRATDRRPYSHPHPHTSHAAHVAHHRFAHQMPVNMDYEVVGFGGGRNRPAAQPPTSKYDPPDPPPPGFTRSPAEDEVVVCPNCGDELAVGDTELKQEVWVIKACGHAYCGDCTHSKAKGSTKASKKGKGRATESSGPMTLKSCVVEGCNNRVNAKSMVHVFF